MLYKILNNYRELIKTWKSEIWRERKEPGTRWTSAPELAVAGNGRKITTSNDNKEKWTFNDYF